jgi:hypothetical protein
VRFAAIAAWQAWALAIGAAGLAAWLFLIKVRPPRLLVPSLLLWRRVLDDRREQTLWERIRKAVSLAITVLIAVMLALAGLGPSLRGNRTDQASGRVVVVLDSSWSMLARTRDGGTRWDRAVAQARRLASGNAEVALATTADGLVEGPTTDLALIDAALDRLAPAGGDATSWPRVGAGGVVHFITDGTVPRPLGADVVLHSVFEPAANVAVTAFGVRPSIAGPTAGDAYLEIANYAPAAQRVRIVLARGTASLLDRQVDMAPGEALRQVFPIERGAEDVLRARISARDNALDTDDEAFAWIEGAKPLAVAIVSEDPSWLRSLFESDASVRATVVSPTEYPVGIERADVVIFDRWGPAEPPNQPALFIAPVSDRRTATEEYRPRWDPSGSHPVVRGVDPVTLTVDRARAYGMPGLVPVARSARGTPLVYVVESPERRVVLITFGPGESNLTSAPAFPVLIGNALDWLSKPTPPESRHPGLATLKGGVSSVTGPRGVTVPLARTPDAVVGVLRSPGVYVAQGGGARATIAVNVGDPQLSNLLRTTLDGSTRASVVTPGGSRQPWWIFLAAVAFGLALVEWWTWQRRITV